MNLGMLLQQRGDLEGVEAAVRRAEEQEHPDGAFRLVGAPEERENLEEAEAAWRRAEERERSPSCPTWGRYSSGSGTWRAARPLGRRAEEGHSAPRGRFTLGGCFASVHIECSPLPPTGAPKCGDISCMRSPCSGRGRRVGSGGRRSRQAGRRGAGEFLAAPEVATLVEQRGDLDVAVLRRSEERGIRAAFDLVLALERAGDLAGAEVAHRRA